MIYEVKVALTLVVAVIAALSVAKAAGRRTTTGRMRSLIFLCSWSTALIGAYALWPFPEMPAWEEPETEQERNARDYAHAIVLPNSVPKPVPFNFAIARLKALLPGQSSVAEQYFRHLCDTEAGAFIFRTVDGVDGFLQMRQRRKYADIELMNPYLIEDPVALLGDARRTDELRRNQEGASFYFVQPFHGKYQFIEQPARSGSGVISFYRSEVVEESRRGDTVGTFDPTTARSVQVPFMIARQALEASSSKYAYTWRGMRRINDRHFGIAGGELLIVDINSNELLAAFRNFKYLGGRGVNARWDVSVACAAFLKDGDENVIPAVLKPTPAVNVRIRTIP